MSEAVARLQAEEIKLREKKLQPGGERRSKQKQARTIYYLLSQFIIHDSKKHLRET
jgi:hypothetical protein